jgi:hypothetical protein
MHACSVPWGLRSRLPAKYCPNAYETLPESTRRGALIDSNRALPSSPSAPCAPRWSSHIVYHLVSHLDGLYAFHGSHHETRGRRAPILSASVRLQVSPSIPRSAITGSLRA